MTQADLNNIADLASRMSPDALQLLSLFVDRISGMTDAEREAFCRTAEDRYRDLYGEPA